MTMTIDPPVSQMQRGENQDQDKKPIVFLDGVLIDVKVGYWRGKEALKAPDLGLEDQNIPEIVTLGRKAIVPKIALEEFDRIDARARWVTERFTFPFPTGSARFVPYSVLPDVMLELNALQARFQEATQVFVDNYDVYRQDVIAKYPQFAEALANTRYGDIKRVSRRFHMTWTIFEVSLPKDIRIRVLDEAQAGTEAVARREAMAKAEASYRQRFDDEINNFLEDSVKTLRARIQESVVRVQAQLAKGDKVSANTLKGVRTAIEQFRTLNFVGDRTVEAAAAQLLDMLPEGQGQESRFTDAEFRAAFDAVLNDTVKTLDASDVSAVTGEYKRRVQFLPQAPLPKPEG